MSIGGVGSLVQWFVGCLVGGFFGGEKVSAVLVGG
tara:strand:- start:207 stop:311 length:105 start_codon:yes stop_codon:yes gene_type:complete